MALVGLFGALVFYTCHCVWVSAEMYSAPSIVLQSRGHDGSVHVFDDFRESYAWLNANTHDNAKVGLKMVAGLLHAHWHVYTAGCLHTGAFMLQCCKCRWQRASCSCSSHGAGND